MLSKRPLQRAQPRPRLIARVGRLRVERFLDGTSRASTTTRTEKSQRKAKGQATSAAPAHDVSPRVHQSLLELPEQKLLGLIPIAMGAALLTGRTPQFQPKDGSGVFLGPDEVDMATGI